MSKKVLVTGGTGLVGSHLLYRLIKEGFEVRAISRKGSNPSALLPVFSFYGNDSPELVQKIQWTEADITDYYSITDALEEVDKVYHCAAYVSFDPSHKSKVFKTNEEGTANMVNACMEKNISKFCFVSSIASLGNSVNGEEITEEATWQSHKRRSNYSLSKFKAEMEVWRGIKEGLNAVIVNPGVIIGAGDDTRSSGAIFKHLGKGTRFYPPGGNAFVDVRDVVQCMMNLMESEVKNERFTLVSENLSYHDFLALLAEAMGVKPPYLLSPRWLAELAWRAETIQSLITRQPPRLTRENVRTSFSTSTYSSEKIKNRFQYQFIPVKKSVKDVSEWYKALK